MNENEKEYEKIIEGIVSTLRCDNLTGVCFDRGCTDGFDTHFVLLAQKIYKDIKEIEVKNEGNNE